MLVTLPNGASHDIGLGTHDRSEARAEADRTYAQLISGTYEPKRVETKPVHSGPSLRTSEAGGEWLAQSAGRLRGTTRETYEVYMRRLAGLMPLTIDLSREAFDLLLSERLSKVQSATVRKEFACYRSFCEFCFARRWTSSLVEVPSVPARAKGTRYEKRRRCAADEFSPSDIEALIAELPEWSRRSRKDGSRYPIRARFLVGYELALRPEVLNVARVGVTWSPGSTEWWIPKEHDKIGLERMLPLSPRCVAALEALGVTDGIIFGDHDYRCVIANAARKAKLPEHKVARLCGQHLRSAGGSHLLELANGQLLGVQYVMGHLRVSTTARYMRASARAGAEVIALATAKRASG